MAAEWVPGDYRATLAAGGPQTSPNRFPGLPYRLDTFPVLQARPSPGRAVPDPVQRQRSATGRLDLGVLFLPPSCNTGVK